MIWKIAAFTALLWAAGTAVAQAPETDSALNESIETLRKPGLFAVELETTVYKPDGAGPFPVAVITGRAGYRKYLERQLPRAFAIAPTGAWGYADGGDDPMGRALANCNRNTKGECRLYSVDDQVVWEPR